MPSGGSKRLKGAGVGVHVALLRGINVGGKNRLPMKELAAIFSRLGCAEVRTYIQSGNVVHQASEALARRAPAAVSAALAGRFGLRVPVVTRTAAELGEVARRNPFLRAGADAGTLHVAFLQEEAGSAGRRAKAARPEHLADRPDPAAVTSLDPARSPPDAFAVRGRDVYLHLPSGVARTRLTNAYFDSKLRTTSTVRNWRTVLQLLEMAGESGPV